MTQGTPPSSAAASSAPPSLPGGWKLERRLGKGGMGEVWLARHTQINSAVAIKILNERYRGNENILARFRQEAVAVQMIKSDAVVKIFDYGVTIDYQPYIMMEYVDGKTLKSWLAEQKAQSAPPEEFQRDVLDLARQIALAMTRAHVSDVVHRDLKPENIMIVEDQRMPRGMGIKILDFGIAKVRYESTIFDPDYTGPMPPVQPARVAPTVPDVRTLVPTVPSNVLQTTPTADVHDTIVSMFPPTVPQEPAGVTGAPEHRVTSSSVQPPAKPETHLGMMGTEGYVAPEQALDPRNVDGRADVYSLGIIIYELLTRSAEPPHREEHIRTGLQWPPEIEPSPGDLASLAARMVSVDRAPRPVMREVHEALHRIYRGDAKFDEAFERWRKEGTLPKGAELHAWLGWSRDKGNLTADEQEFLKIAAAKETRRQRFYILLQTIGLGLLFCVGAAAVWFWLEAREQARINEIEKQKEKDINKQLEDTNGNLEATNTALRAAESSLEQTIAKVEDLTQNNADCTSVRDVLKQGKDDATAAANAAVRKYKKEQEVNDTVTTELTQCKTEKAGLRTNNDQLNQYLTACSGKFDKCSTERTQLEQQNAILDAGIAKARSDYEECKHQNDECKHQNDECKHQNEGCNNAKNELDAKLTACRAACAPKQNPQPQPDTPGAPVPPAPVPPLPAP